MQTITHSVGSIPIGNVAYGGGCLWLYGIVNNNYCFEKIDPSSGAILQTITHSVGSIPIGNVAYGGGCLWLYGIVNNNYCFEKIDPDSGAILQTITHSVGSIPIGNVAYGGGCLWLYGIVNNNYCFEKIDPSSGAILQTITHSVGSIVTGSFTFEQQWAIATSSSPSDGGSTSGGGTYDDWTTAAVTATANSCNSFMNWTEGGTVVSASPSYSFTVTTNQSLVANFAPITYALIITNFPSGAGTASDGGTFDCGSSAQIMATPNSGYLFNGWSGTGSGSYTGTNNPATVTMNGPITETANYVAVPETGSLRVTIAPEAAVIAGAQWEVDGGTWQNSEAIVTNLSVRDHTVIFNTISGWTSPANQTVSVSASSTATATGVYTQTVQAQFFTFTTNNGAITITGYIGSGGAVTIPTNINGLPVTRIGQNAFARSGLTGVTIPSSVTTIGDLAFNNCAYLTSVTIPDSVTSIGDYAFQECFSLNSITIPDGVTNLGYATFYNCRSLASVTIGNRVTTIIGFAPTQVNQLEEGVFQYCSSLTTVTIGNSVTNVGYEAFEGCTNLTSLYFDGNTPTVGSAVFAGDTNATVYYFFGTSGWSNRFDGLPAVMLNAPVPAGSLQVTITPAGAISGGAQWYRRWRNSTAQRSDRLGSVGGQPHGELQHHQRVDNPCEPEHLCQRKFDSHSDGRLRVASSAAVQLHDQQRHHHDYGLYGSGWFGDHPQHHHRPAGDEHWGLGVRILHQPGQR